MRIFRTSFDDICPGTMFSPGWSGIKNGLLLTQAADSAFEVMVTMDSGVPYQQNQATLPLAVIVLEAKSNDIDDLGPLIPKLLAAITSLKPRTVVHIQ